MIQFTFRAEHDLDPSPPIDMAPVASGERAPFLRDRTFGESEDFIHNAVRKGDFVPGVYKVYHDGLLMGTVTSLCGPYKFDEGDAVSVLEMGDASLMLRDGHGKRYYPNQGTVKERRRTTTGNRYIVSFPGAENVGTDKAEFFENVLIGWVREAV